MDNLYERVKEIIEDLDKEQYPESYEIIEESILEEEKKVLCDAMFLANSLHEADTTEAMPPKVASLIIEIYLDAIADENPEAMTNLGSLYYTGRCGEQNYEKAIKYYDMADKHGERQATENLGYCYYYGRAGEVDYKKAYHYFVKGALDNHLNSLYKIGDMYRNGYYVDKDEHETYHIYTHCYEQMTPSCARLFGADICMRNGDLFFYGIGTEVDYFKAIAFYHEAENFFYAQIKDGNFYSSKGLKGVIEKQEQCREKINEQLPTYEWRDK